MVLSCLSDIKCCMSQNFLKLNDSKLEILLPAPVNIIPAIQSSLGLGGLTSNVKPSSFESCSTLLSSAKNYLREVISILSGPENISCAFISSHLDYCNTLFSGLSQKATSHLQLDKTNNKIQLLGF